MNAAEKPYGSNSEKLLQELCGCRDAGLFLSQIRAGKTGMNGRQRNCGSQNAKERFAAGFMKPGTGDKGRLAPQDDSGCCGGQKGQRKSGEEPGVLFFSAGKSGEAGDGSLHAGSGQRMAYGKNRKNQLIDAYSFRTESLGKEYLIEEPKKTAQQSGSSEDQGPFEKYRKLFHKKLFFLQYIHGECLTEPISDVIIKNEFRVKY